MTGPAGSTQPEEFAKRSLGFSEHAECQGVKLVTRGVATSILKS